MSRTAVIGDVHGSRKWEEIVNRETWGKVIFLGDYFDDYQNSACKVQIENFLDITRYKINTPSVDVHLLRGNHDFHYLPQAGDDCYSGWQGLSDIRKVLEENQNILEMAHEDQGFLCTHAGVTEPWQKNWMLPGDNLAEEINSLWQVSPEAFRFNHRDRSGYGDHPIQGPIWVRPEALQSAFAVPKQIVGHTKQQEVTQVGGLVFNDCLAKGEFVIIKDGEIVVGRL